MKQRLLFIDFLRGAAILGVLADHAVAIAVLHDALPNVIRVPVLLGVRSATPLFFFIFGIMLEYVYVRRAEGGIESVRSTSRKLLRRGWMVYLAYAVVTMVAFAGGHLDSQGALRALTFTGASHLTDVLKFYALALVVAAVALPLRLRIGSRVSVVACILPWLAMPLLSLVPWPQEGTGVAGLTAVIFGRPTGESFYSLLHGWTIVGAGLLVGIGLRQWRVSQDLATCRRILVWITGAGLLGLLVLAGSYGLEAFLHQYRGAAGLRMSHPPIYYFSGIFAAGLLVLVSSYVIRQWMERWAIMRGICFMGAHSLATFSIGNVLLLAMPANLETWPIATRCAMIAVVMVAPAIILGIARSGWPVQMVDLLVMRIPWPRRREDQQRSDQVV